MAQFSSICSTKHGVGLSTDHARMRQAGSQQYADHMAKRWMLCLVRQGDVAIGLVSGGRNVCVWWLS
jgi:hypothetical protein